MVDRVQAVDEFYDVCLATQVESTSLVISGNVHALALHGAVPPSMAVLVYPQHEPSIDAVAAWANLNRLESQMQRGYFVLYPGDVLPFGTPLDGCRVVPMTGPDTPWSQDGQPLSNNFAMLAQPVLRVWRVPSVYPARLGFVDIAGVSAVLNIPTSGTPTSADSAWLGYDAEHVLIHWRDDNGITRTRIQGAETADFEVWWMLANGMWSHNPSDDCKATTARGAITASHDVEYFQVPKGVVAVGLVKTSGNIFLADAISSRGQP